VSRRRVCSNWEWQADRALRGFDVGVADARGADAAHRACGGPSIRPMFFSVDIDVADYVPRNSDPRVKLGPIAGYFDGILYTLGVPAPVHTAAYGWPNGCLMLA
jgi:hypothetical protein